MICHGKRTVWFNFEAHYVSSYVFLPIHYYFSFNIVCSFCNLGLTSSIILRSGRLSDLLAQLQELCKGVNEVEISPEKYDSSILRAQVLQLILE